MSDELPSSGIDNRHTYDPAYAAAPPQQYAVAPQYGIQPQSPHAAWQQPPATAPLDGRATPWLWIAMALVATVAFAVAVTVVVAQQDSSGRGSWTAQPGAPLSSVYTRAPEAGWTVSTADVEETAGESLDGFEWYGVKDYGDVLLTALSNHDGKDLITHLVAVDAGTGQVLWTTPSGGHSPMSCADETVAGVLICSNPLSPELGGPSELRFYRTDTGELARTEAITGLRSVHVVDGVIYTAGFVGSEAWIASGDVDDVSRDWRVEYPLGDCEASEYTAVVRVGDMVVFGSFAGDASTGEMLNPESTYAQVLPGDRYIATTPCTDGGQYHSERRVWDIVDSSGTTLWTNIADGPASIVMADNATADVPYFTEHIAYDSSSGEKLWQTAENTYLWSAVGAVVFGIDQGHPVGREDDRIVAFDATTGDELWRVHRVVVTFCQVSDGKHCISSSSPDGDDGEVTASDLTTGEDAWSLGVDRWGPVHRCGDGLVVAQFRGDIVYYPPPAA